MQEEAQHRRRRPTRSTTYRRTRNGYEGKPLPAGRYVTEEFKPTMSFTLGKGWTRGGIELRNAWDIRDIDNDANWLGFLNAEEVYVPNGSGGLKVAPVPEDAIFSILVLILASLVSSISLTPAPRKSRDERGLFVVSSRVFL